MTNQDSETDKKGAPLTKRVATAALAGGSVLWVASLGLQSLTGYGPTEGVFGLMILLFGWFYPAWWANPILALAMILAYSSPRNTAYVLVFLAVVLSFSTFLMYGFPASGGLIFGLGLGGLLWLVSIQFIGLGVLSLAAITVHKDSLGRRRARLTLLVILCTTVASFIAMVFTQRFVVNTEERPYFEAPIAYRTFLKVGPVCRLAQPSPEPLSLATRSLGMGSWKAAPGAWRPTRMDFLLHAGISPLVFDDREVAATDSTAGVAAVRPRSIDPSVLVHSESVSKLAAPRSVSGTRLTLRTNEVAPQIREFTWWSQERVSKRTCPRSRPQGRTKGTSSERFVVAAMGDADRANTFPGEHVVRKSFLIVSEQIVPPSNSERISIAPTCEGKIALEKLQYTDWPQWRGFGWLGPLHNGTKDTVYFLTQFGEVNGWFVNCHDNWVLAVSHLFHARALDVILIERESMRVRRLIRADSPLIGGYRPLWQIDNAKLINESVHIYLSNYAKTNDGTRRTQAELVLGLETGAR